MKVTGHFAHVNALPSTRHAPPPLLSLGRVRVLTSDHPNHFLANPTKPDWMKEHARGETKKCWSILLVINIMTAIWDFKYFMIA